MLALKLNKRKMIINLAVLFAVVIIIIFMLHKNFFSTPNVSLPDVLSGAKFDPGMDVPASVSSGRINIKSVQNINAAAAILKHEKFKELKDNSVIIDISNVERGKDNPFKPIDAATSTEE